MSVQLYSFIEFDEDVAQKASQHPNKNVDLWWTLIKATDPTIRNARFTKLFSQMDDIDISEAKVLMENHLIPPLDIEPGEGFNLYFSEAELTGSSNAACQFEYLGNWKDYKDLPIKLLPDKAKQFMVMGEDYSYFRATRTIQ